MIITKTIEIDMGHRVPNHKSKCRSLHGHRYKIEVAVNDKVIMTKGSSEEGMVIDFGDLKNVMMEIIDGIFDHAFCMYDQDEFVETFRRFVEMNQQKIVFVPFIPTAENLAKHWYELVKSELLNYNIKIHHVKVWETPTSTATYREE